VTGREGEGREGEEGRRGGEERGRGEGEEERGVLWSPKKT